MSTQVFTKKRWIIVGVGLVAAAGIWAVLAVRRDQKTTEYEFTHVERGTLENIISGTGTLQAVGTVQVGTQVSGTIQTIMVDYNDQVRKGQVLAVLDTTMLSAAVRDAQAGVMRAQAEYERASREYRRDEELFASHFVTETQYQNSSTAMQTAHATLLSAEAGLDRATANLRYAVITSPISGTVIQRNNEPGQTVAASLSAPTLFLIAEDLARMEILGLVDESDIGSIREGQPVRFVVEAQPDRTFEGTVKQIRLQPSTVQNVVNYTVVIDAPNPERFLLPGMTATIDFIVERIADTLLVSNRALRFQPSEAMQAALEASREKRFSELPDSLRAQIAERRQRRAPEAGGFPGRATVGGGAAVNGQLWFLDERGDPAMVMVRKGATDGSRTVIAPLEPPGGRPSRGDPAAARGAPRAEEGMAVIAGVKNGPKSSPQSKSTGAFAQPFGPPPR